jgi:transcriptional regulator of acetoin/glycerol metabolism
MAQLTVLDPPTPAADLHAMRVLEAVRHGPTQANDIVARSWTRCLNDHRLQPDRACKPSVLPSAALAVRRERLADVIDCARYEMTTLYQQLADAESAVVLTDTDGVILHMVSSSEFGEEVAPLGFHVGAVWSEAEAGTNGMGTCAVAASPIAVRREEHFFTQFTSLTCSAVPVFDPSGAMAAVLDVTSRSSLLQQHSLVLLGMTAQMIENRLLDHRFPNAHPLHFHSRPEFVYTLHEGRLAVSAEGEILAGNRSALFQLGLRSMAELRERRLEELFQTRMPDIVSRSLRSAFHPVVTYGTHPASRFFLVARRPAAEAGSSTPTTTLPRAHTGRAAATRPAAAPSSAAERYADSRLARAFESANRALTRDIPVLLHGETGSGKEVFARALHAASPKAAGAFVAVNCASLPESLIESELFGYRAGAFTGAQRSGRRGKVLEADRGTLFLDEIGDMPLALQARLLRVLDERRVTPLGAEETIEVDFQLLSASHRPLPQLVAQGLFREDLYYRLCGIEVSLPPLRERSDRRSLILELLGAESEGTLRLSAAAENLLMQHPWPGNVRQLRHVLKSAAALCDGTLITPDHLPSLRASAAGVATASPARAAEVPGEAQAEAPEPLPPLNTIQLKEREGLLQVLEEHRWNVSNVAKALDVSRNTLYRKLHKLHITLSHPTR